MEEISISSSAFSLISLIFLSVSSTAISISVHETSFFQCFSSYFPTLHTNSPVNVVIIYTQNSSSYNLLLESSLQNLRFLNPSTPKPLFIVTPTNESHIQASIICSRLHGLQLRVRSGGHDFEGLSSASSSHHHPFILLDLVNLRSMTIDFQDNTMWVRSGAILGELYHTIAKHSNLLAFAGGLCHTVGIGGQVGGGGIGTLMRKYGLAADNVVDAILIDAEGQIHDRKSMGEDLFWAIRGGGAMNFGVAFSWKVRLVPVPPVVTAFTIIKTLEQGAAKLVERWQDIAYVLDEDFFFRVFIRSPKVQQPTANRTLEFLFNALFLGPAEELLFLMEESLPELGLKAKDCLEMPWVESTVYFADLPYGPGQSVDVLLDRATQEKLFYKGKSDFLQKPIPASGLEGIWERMLEEEDVYMIIDPLGGKMNEIPAAEIPFPFRKGYLYNVLYVVRWGAAEAGSGNFQEHVDWIRRLHDYLSPYVSVSPRGAYLNYRDLDLGVNDAHASYWTARSWGDKYFGGNFRRLARVKGLVDPTNFLRFEQSIPPLTKAAEQDHEGELRESV